MFGLPEYRSFDPTAWLTLSFLVFFGACFGDVVYGLMLMGVSVYVMRKHRHSWVRSFFQLFLYAGMFAVIFGLLTGTWMGDFLVNTGNKYVSADNPLVQFATLCAVFDPMQKALAALAIALGLGIVNQFYGIGLRMGMEIRKGDYAAAVFDAGLWLVMLPGLLLVIAPMFVPGVPSSLVTTGWCLLGIGALGLVLTQGRNEEGVVVKAVTGVVSLYGILGTYGATSFIGDMLSYSRLVALGLTTTIIGMSVNIIAGLLKGWTPYGIPVGIPLFVFILLIGHVGNFAMSILGAFVHPARLILLEFFNRFYTAGGARFAPLGFDSKRVEIVKDGNA
jgi:V/A-type H+-transporting ATPase subunit I